MAVEEATVLSAVRIGEVTQVAVASSLPGVVWYCWYFDGAYAGKTAGPTKTFRVAAGGQFRLSVLATDQADFDPVQNAPDGFPSRWTLWWVRSLAVDAARYKIEQKEGDGDWTLLAQIAARPGQWDYTLLTERLKDLTAYTWRVTPIDAAGNEGTPLVIGPETIVRWPDAPAFTAQFNPQGRTVSFFSNP